jgi:major membrane immunogen (membrane-anchored lipoprotein)
LALLACHQPDANLWRITKGFPETDYKGNLVNIDEVWRSIARYAMKVARLVDCEKRYKEAKEPTKPDDEPSSEDKNDEAVSSEAQAEADPTALAADEATSSPPAN